MKFKTQEETIAEAQCSECELGESHTNFENGRRQRPQYVELSYVNDVFPFIYLWRALNIIVKVTQALLTRD